MVLTQNQIYIKCQIDPTFLQNLFKQFVIRKWQKIKTKNVSLIQHYIKQITLRKVRKT